MQSGDLPTSDLESFASRVVVNGVEREHGSWSVRRKLNGDLPAQVVAGSGITQARGSIVWAKAAGVSDREIHPWSHTAGWPPSSGDRVIIYAGDGVSEWPVFTGRIDETSGDVGSGMESTIVDDIDQLNVRFSQDALLRIMPPLHKNEPNHRGVGLSSLYYVDAALRTAGFYATPANEPDCALSVPAQSSMWPEVGTMTWGSDTGADGGDWGTYYDAPLGVAMNNVKNVYSPRLTKTAASPVQLTAICAPANAAGAYMKVSYGTETITLAFSASRSAVVSHNGVEVCRLFIGAGQIVTLLVKNGAWTLRTDAGAEATGTAAVSTASAMSEVEIATLTGARAAGFQVSHPAAASEFQALSHVPSANYRMKIDPHIGNVEAIPAIREVAVIDLLKQISEATLTAMWIDERGVFQWAPSLGLRSQASVQTIDTLDDIRSLSWADSLQSVRSKVNVDYRAPLITVSRWDNVFWYQGSGGTLESGQDVNTFIESGADVDWVQLSPSFYILGKDSGSISASNRGRGCITGATLTDETTESAGGPYLEATLEQVTLQVLKMKHTALTLPAETSLELRYPSESTTIRTGWLKENFPIIRGFGRVEWTDRTLSSAITGPFWAPMLIHDGSHWNAIQEDTSALQGIADYLAEHVTKPAPSINGMRVGFDPRRQLGDVITINSKYLLGLTLTALIVDLQDGADGSYTQTLGVRIISAQSTYTTYQQFSEAWGPTANYEAFSAVWAATDTYDDFSANPLGGTE